jgi:hypothetical protein
VNPLRWILRAAGALIISLAVSLPASAAVLTYDREELPGGAVLLVKESQELPIITIRVSFPGGTRYEPLEKQGLANLTAGMLVRGTRRRSSSAIEKLNDRIGGGVGVSAGRDFSAASIRLLTRDLERGMDLLADVLRKPERWAAFSARKTARAISPTALSASASSAPIPTGGRWRALPRPSKKSGERIWLNSTGSATG